VAPDGSAEVTAGSAGHFRERDFAIQATAIVPILVRRPDYGRQIGSIAGEPGIPVVAGSARLTAGIRNAGGIGSCLTRNDIPERVIDLVERFLLQSCRRQLGSGLPYHVAVARDDLRDRHRS